MSNSEIDLKIITTQITAVFKMAKVGFVICSRVAHIFISHRKLELINDGPSLMNTSRTLNHVRRLYRKKEKDREGVCWPSRDQ